MVPMTASKVLFPAPFGPSEKSERPGLELEAYTPKRRRGPERRGSCRTTMRSIRVTEGPLRALSRGGFPR